MLGRTNRGKTDWASCVPARWLPILIFEIHPSVAGMDLRCARTASPDGPFAHMPQARVGYHMSRPVVQRAPDLLGWVVARFRSLLLSDRQPPGQQHNTRLRFSLLQPLGWTCTCCGKRRCRWFRSCAGQMLLATLHFGRTTSSRQESAGRAVLLWQLARSHRGRAFVRCNLIRGEAAGARDPPSERLRRYSTLHCRLPKDELTRTDSLHSARKQSPRARRQRYGSVQGIPPD